MQFHDIDEWLDYILSETVPMTSQMTQLSSIHLIPQLTNTSLNKRSPSKMLQSYKQSSNHVVKVCQHSPSNIIVKATRNPSRLGRLLCQKNKPDDAFKNWLDKLVFVHPVAQTFDESVVTNRKKNKPTSTYLSVKLYKHTLPFMNSNDVSWKELERRIYKRQRNINDDPFDGNAKATLIKVLSSQDLTLLNNGLASDLLAVYLSLLDI